MPPRKDAARETTTTPKSLWSRAFAKGAEFEKDELLDVLYWIRQIISVILGVIWGIVPLTGAFGLVSYCALSSAVVYGHFSAVLGLDEEEFGGAWDLIKEGFMPGFALFLVSWITVYSGLHFD
eukprot:Opistho-2@32512